MRTDNNERSEKVRQRCESLKIMVYADNIHRPKASIIVELDRSLVEQNYKYYTRKMRFLRKFFNDDKGGRLGVSNILRNLRRTGVGGGTMRAVNNSGLKE